MPVHLYDRRIDAGLTTHELAEKTGVAVGTINRAENGGGVQVGTIHRLAKGLGCEVSDLTADSAAPTEVAG